MLMHEEFIRCPECDNAYFKKVEYSLLDKVRVKQKSASPYEIQTTTEWVCIKCAHILTKKVTPRA